MLIVTRKEEKRSTSLMWHSKEKSFRKRVGEERGCEYRAVGETGT